MLKKQNIICISSIDWDFIWQGHQEIMSTFAKNGNRVLFIENTGIRIPTLKDLSRLKKRFINWLRSIKGFSQKMENLYVYSSLILPFPYSRIARWINRRLLLGPLKRWMRIMEFHNPLIWTFLPTGTALDIINNIDMKLLVYYCIADFNELVDNPKKVKKTEVELIKKSNLIFAQGKALQDKCRGLNNNVYIFPFGVKIETFENFQYSLAKIPSDIKDIKKPIIGYIGGVHRHIDFELIRNVAQVHPEWSIVLVGPLQTDITQIEALPNVFLLGKKNFADLPAYIYRFDVCIIPYIESGYTKTVYPTKLNEYHIMGKPVVSTYLPEVIEFNKNNNDLIVVARTHREFIELISKAMQSNDRDSLKLRIESAKKNSWGVKIEEMSNLIEDVIDKKSRASLDWRESFLKLYGVARRKTLGTIFIFSSIYFLIFYTPLVWFLAKPLKFSQEPQKVDAIIVFSGGVGESGKAGQGYEERVQYAVELYRQGYAGHLIFSSGYIYAFKEPIVMKALAVSLGVPEKAIILEDKATNTYKNVKFSKEILDKNNWNKILLVSSPYHMRRASLVFNKIAKGVRVCYTPIPKSLFYSHENRDIYGRKIWRRVNLIQIKAIIHEYLGIVYYWWRGWI